MSCDKCKKEIHPTVFAMYGPLCVDCRTPKLTKVQKAIEDRVWWEIINRTNRVAYPYEGWETAAPALETV